jgi:hypothetical protein
MRPQGEIRQAIVGMAPLKGEGAVTWKGLAALAQVSLDAARVTAMNALRAGDLVVVGEVREPGVSRPMNLLARAPEAACAANDDDPALALVRCWANFR